MNSLGKEEMAGLWLQYTNKQSHKVRAAMMRVAFISVLGLAVLVGCSDSEERAAWKRADAGARAFLAKLERDGFVKGPTDKLTADDQRAVWIARGFVGRDDCVARYKPTKTPVGYQVYVSQVGRSSRGYLYEFPPGGGFFSVSISSNWWNATVHPGM